MTFKFSKSVLFDAPPVGFLPLEERLVEADTRAAYFQTACEELLQINKHLEECQKHMEERIAALERRLGLNSRTSGKPPSSDGLGKPNAKKRTKSLRGPSDRKSGGQPGHTGKTLRQTPTPDTIIDHFPVVCSGCGAPLGPETAEASTARQVIDLPPPPPPQVTEHRTHQCRCDQCDGITRADFPDGINAPVQYGARIAGIASYLQTVHCIPEHRLGEIFIDLLGVPIGPATLTSLIWRTADRLKPMTLAIKEALIGSQSGVVHLDETGQRAVGKLHWTHVICSPLLSHFRVSSKRGELLCGVSGIVVHDHWKAYFKMEGVEHALCNAHHLRELQALIEIEKEPWAKPMKAILLKAKTLAENMYNEGGQRDEAAIQTIFGQYDANIAEAIAYHEALPALSSAQTGKKRRGRPKRRTGHNLALRLQDFKTEVLRFLVDPNVPFTNNEAERDLRMGKVRQKVSGCFRTLRGAEVFCILRTVVNTARKQGWSIMDTLLKPPDQLIAVLRFA